VVAEVGQALLGVGFGLALVAILRPTRALLALGTAAIAAATAVLAWALLTSDFSLAYVAETSRRGANGWYRFAALWGGSAGSLLVLAFVVGIVAVAAAGRWTTPAERRILAVPVAALAGVALIVADPFASAGLTPVDGVGLTPILEHPAMAIHPPLLYIGLAATLPPYAAAVAGRLDVAARARARRWLLLVVGALTVAMALGGLWSYVEAGWGGYWAWDPVENTSLVVWLAALVALHRGVAGRDGPKALPAVLAAAGTALTRSGVISSVHAFAEDATLGWILGGLAVVALAGAVVAWNRAMEGGRRTSARTAGQPFARVAAALLGAALTVVAIGTATPVGRRLTGDPGTAVGGWFYARLVGAVAVVALGALVVAAPVQVRTRAIAVGTGAAAGVIALAGGWGVAGAGLAAFAVAAVVTSGASAARGHGPMWLAHLGVGVLLIGVAGTSATQVETTALATGATEQVGPIRVTNDGVSVMGETTVAADVRLDDGGATRSARAALVAYPAWDGVLAETAVWSRPWRDVQVALVRADDAGRAVLEVRVRPLAQLLWWGAVLTAAGVALSARRVSDRRASSGAASPASSSGPAARVPPADRPPPPDQRRPPDQEAAVEATAAEMTSAGQSRRAPDPDPAATAATPGPGAPAGRARSTSPPGSMSG
jgi:cytochrome c-type biogenesis protein CcmF